MMGKRTFSRPESGSGKGRHMGQILIRSAGAVLGAILFLWAAGAVYLWGIGGQGLSQPVPCGNRTAGRLQKAAPRFQAASGLQKTAPRLQETNEGEKIVIVIDPGHGGENFGTVERGHLEKAMDMTTALAMYEELLLYDNVEVYLTHREDEDMSLKARAEFAAEVNADFLFSIHYNASENHELFGTEVWVSVLPPYNGYGYQFGYEFLRDRREEGMFMRGIKARPGESGGDYYGIIRHSVALGIPAVIIEHCHVDEARDAVYCDDEQGRASTEKLQAFGRADATAVARYFGLRSSTLGVDYSGYELVPSETEQCVRATVRDETEPEECRMEVLEADYEGATVTLKVSAVDRESTLLYYSYSLDGGIVFSRREPWPGSDALAGVYDESFVVTIPIERGTAPRIVVRAYNMYDLYGESALWESPRIFPTEPPAWAKMDVLPVNGGVWDMGKKEADVRLLMKLFLAAAVLLSIMLFLLRCITGRPPRDPEGS